MECGEVVCGEVVKWCAESGVRRGECGEGIIKEIKRKE
jgi:hypothetical protein